MDPLRRAVQHLARFPGVGEKTATRFAYWLLGQPPEVAEGLADAIRGLRASVRECTRCHDLTDGVLCRRCNDAGRDDGLICVVERPQDIAAIDACSDYRGRFHVLHGALNPLAGIGPGQLRVADLLERAASAQEVILAMDPDVDGDTTALFLARALKPHGVRVTRLAHGVSVGTEIEFADRVSLRRALDNRREI